MSTGRRATKKRATSRNTVRNAPKRPVIGVTPDWSRPDPKSLARYELRVHYADAIVAGGGLPMVLPYTDDRKLIAAYLDRVDGLVVSGGAFDVPPEEYGEKRMPWCGPAKVERTRFERRLIEGALERNMPLLGICGGMQLLNVVLGGTLYQDLGNELPEAAKHEQKGPRTQPSHPIDVRENTLLAKAVGPGLLMVNSTHHQAIRDLGKGVKANALAPDGVVEGIESREFRFAVGVQWHPELLLDSVPSNLGVYRSLVKAAGRARLA